MIDNQLKKYRQKKLFESKGMEIKSNLLPSLSVKLAVAVKVSHLLITQSFVQKKKSCIYNTSFIKICYHQKKALHLYSLHMLIIKKFYLLTLG